MAVSYPTANYQIYGPTTVLVSYRVLLPGQPRIIAYPRYGSRSWSEAYSRAWMSCGSCRSVGRFETSTVWILWLPMMRMYSAL